MVSRRAFFISITLLLAGQANAAPFFVKTSGLTARSAVPLDSIVGRSIPSEIAVRAPDGIIVPFSKREEEELLRRQDNTTSTGNVTVVIDNSPPADVPGGNLNKVNPQNLPEEAAVESPNGVIQAYNKRFFKRQDNSTSTGNGTSGGNITVVVDNSPPPDVPGGNLNKVNPQNLPEEAAVESPNGIVQPYNKRAGRLFGRQDSTTDNSTTADGSSSTCNSTVVVDNSPPPPVPEGNDNTLNPEGISDDKPTSANDGIVTPLKRKARRFISSEIPTRSLNGEIELY